MLIHLLDKSADKMRKGEEGSEHSPNNRQGKTCRQAGMIEWPQSTVQDGRPPESHEGSEAGGRQLVAVA